MAEKIVIGKDGQAVHSPQNVNAVLNQENTAPKDQNKEKQLPMFESDSNNAKPGTNPNAAHHFEREIPAFDEGQSDQGDQNDDSTDTHRNGIKLPVFADEVEDDDPTSRNGIKLPVFADEVNVFDRIEDDEDDDGDEGAVFFPIAQVKTTTHADVSDVTSDNSQNDKKSEKENDSATENGEEKSEEKSEEKKIDKGAQRRALIREQRKKKSEKVNNAEVVTESGDTPSDAPLLSSRRRLDKLDKAALLYEAHLEKEWAKEQAKVPASRMLPSELEDRNVEKYQDSYSVQPVNEVANEGTDKIRELRKIERDLKKTEENLKKTEESLKETEENIKKENDRLLAELKKRDEERYAEENVVYADTNSSESNKDENEKIVERVVHVHHYYDKEEVTEETSYTEATEEKKQKSRKDDRADKRLEAKDARDDQREDKKAYEERKENDRPVDDRILRRLDLLKEELDAHVEKTENTAVVMPDGSVLRIAEIAGESSSFGLEPNVHETLRDETPYDTLSEKNLEGKGAKKALYIAANEVEKERSGSLKNAVKAERLDKKEIRGLDRHIRKEQRKTDSGDDLAAIYLSSHIAEKKQLIEENKAALHAQNDASPYSEPILEAEYNNGVWGDYGKEEAATLLELAATAKAGKKERRIVAEDDAVAIDTADVAPTLNFSDRGEEEAATLLSIAKADKKHERNVAPIRKEYDETDLAQMHKRADEEALAVVYGGEHTPVMKDDAIYEMLKKQKEDESYSAAYETRKLQRRIVIKGENSKKRLKRKSEYEALAIVYGPEYAKKAMEEADGLYVEGEVDVKVYPDPTIIARVKTKEELKAEELALAAERRRKAEFEALTMVYGLEHAKRVFAEREAREALKTEEENNEVPSAAVIVVDDNGDVYEEYPDINADGTVAVVKVVDEESEKKETTEEAVHYSDVDGYTREEESNARDSKSKKEKGTESYDEHLDKKQRKNGLVYAYEPKRRNAKNNGEEPEESVVYGDYDGEYISDKETRAYRAKRVAERITDNSKDEKAVESYEKHLSKKEADEAKKNGVTALYIARAKRKKDEKVEKREESKAYGDNPYTEPYAPEEKAAVVRAKRVPPKRNTDAQDKKNVERREERIDNKSEESALREAYVPAVRPRPEKPEKKEAPVYNDGPYTEAYTHVPTEKELEEERLSAEKAAAKAEKKAERREEKIEKTEKAVNEYEAHKDGKINRRLVAAALVEFYNGNKPEKKTPKIEEAPEKIYADGVYEEAYTPEPTEKELEAKAKAEAKAEKREEKATERAEAKRDLEAHYVEEYERYNENKAYRKEEKAEMLKDATPVKAENVYPDPVPNDIEEDIKLLESSADYSDVLDGAGVTLVGAADVRRRQRQDKNLELLISRDKKRARKAMFDLAALDIAEKYSTDHSLELADDETIIRDDEFYKQEKADRKAVKLYEEDIENQELIRFRNEYNAKQKTAKKQKEKTEKAGKFTREYGASYDPEFDGEFNNYNLPEVHPYTEGVKLKLSNSHGKRRSARREKLSYVDNKRLSSIADMQRKTDIAMIEARVRAQHTELDLEVIKSEWQFSHEFERRKEIKWRKNAKKKLRNLRARITGAVGFERMDNRRYYSVVATNFETVELPDTADREALIAMREELMRLLDIRDDINAKLLELYTGNENGMKRNADLKGRAKAEIKARKRGYRKYRKLYRLLNKMRTTRNERMRIFNRMDHYLDTKGELARVKYILKNERPAGRVLREYKRDKRKAKSDLRILRRVIDRSSIKALRRAKKRSIQRRVMTISYTILILLVLGICVVTAMGPQIYESIKGNLPENVRPIVEAILGGGKA